MPAVLSQGWPTPRPTTGVPSHAKLALVAVLHKEQLGLVIKGRREDLGLTQKQLAERAHVKESQTVSRWERGEREPNDLGAVAAALQFSSVSEMLAGIDMPEKRRRRADPEGGTLLERMASEQRRIERKLDALLDHFKLNIDTVSDAVEAFEAETADAAEQPVVQTPPRRRRRSA